MRFTLNRFMIPVLVCSLTVSCITSGKREIREEQKMEPCTQTAKLSGGMTFMGNSGGNKPLPGSPYGYELWSAAGSDNNLTWYGPDRGGGAAFRAEWNKPDCFLGRVGYYWNEGKPFTAYKNIFCDFNFSRSPNGTAGSWSYIGIYGWSKNPMIEWYIADDWFGYGIIGPSVMGGGAVKKGEFTVDGAVYFMYQATRPAGSGNIEGSNEPFVQYFSIRQERRQCGTISVTEHFKKWEELGMALGNNLYEAKFLVEAGSGTGWMDASWISFFQKD